MDSADLIAREEDDVSLPRAALNKLIKETVPEARLTLDARDLILKISHEFIHSLAQHSNTACNQAGKKTMMPDHVLEGLSIMGLETYKNQAKIASEEAREEMKTRKAQTSKFKFQRHTEEDYCFLLEMQQKMFEQARVQMEMNCADDVGSVGLDDQCVLPPAVPITTHNDDVGNDATGDDEDDENYYG